MRSSLALLALGAATAMAVAIPEDITKMKRNIIARQSKNRNNLVKRNSVTTGADDATILEFALILEHLEDVFYSQALQKFDQAAFDAAGYSGVYPVLEQVAYDEAAHVAFLTAGLKAAGVENPPQRCEYSFPYTDVASFLALSQVIENVGVSAYLGAAGDISNPGYVTAAGSILTVEARHNAFIRLLNNYLPNPEPFDTPQSASNVVSIVTPFFKSCPEGSAPAIKGHPALTATSGLATTLGGSVTVSVNSSDVDLSKYKVYCGWASGLNAEFTEYADGACPVPTSGIAPQGQKYLTLTRWTSLDDQFTLAGPAILETSTQNVTVTIPTLAAAGSSSPSASGSASSSAPIASMASSMASSAAASATASA